jgi:hypothetical protein
MTPGVIGNGRFIEKTTVLEKVAECSGTGTHGIGETLRRAQAILSEFEDIAGVLQGHLILKAGRYMRE